MKNKIINLLCALSAVFLAGSAYKLSEKFTFLENMLPAHFKNYIAVGILVFVLVALVLGFFMLPKFHEKEHKTGLRLTCCFLCFAIGICTLEAENMIHKSQETLDAITEIPEEEHLINIYVLKDDPAESLEDASDYKISCSTSFEEESTKKALELISKKADQEYEVTWYPSEFDLVDALYDGTEKAILLNPAYLDILTSLPGYEDFEEKTKVICSQNLTEVVEETEPETEPETTIAETEAETEPVIDESVYDPFILYVSGSDTRKKMLSVGRSDVNILAVMNPSTKQVLLINTPRDFYIPNPASPDGALDKLTHCGIYGVENSIRALENLYGHPIDYYTQINFTGFETLIDAIGGVTVTAEQSFHTRINGVNYSFQKGENNLNGSEALAFARERYSFADGDHQRGRNQMKVIQSVIDKCTSGTTIISRYSEILDSLQGMFVTSVPQEKITDLVTMQLSEPVHWDVKTYAVIGTGASKTTYSTKNRRAYVMIPDQSTVDRGKNLIERVLNDEILTDEDVKR